MNESVTSAFNAAGTSKVGLAMIDLLIAVIFLGIIFYVVWWGLTNLGLPEPFGKIAQAIVIFIVVIVLLGLMTGHGPHIAHYDWGHL